jgi:two-component system sensor histidine kinase/response regulator
MTNQLVKILIVDDQPNNLHFLSNILLKQGYKVQRAISGQLALNAANAAPPNLVLLDILMPEMNGYEVCHKLKGNEKTREVPVIFLSALHEAIDKVKAFKVGGVDFITKPFQAEEVLARIENQLTIQKLQRQLQEHNRALQQSEARLQKLTANLPGMLFEFLRHANGSSQFAYVSSGCREIYELEPEQLLENAAIGFDIIHPDDRPSLMASIDTSAQTLEPWVWEGRIITPSAQLKWTQGAARPEHLANGDILWHGLVVDVSDRKFSNALLRESQQRLSFLVQQTPLAVIEWSNSLEIIAWNPAAEATFGYSQQEAIGCNLIALLVPESAREQALQVANDLLQQQGGTYSLSENRTKDGKIIICEWYNTPLIDESGHMIGGASMAVDITHRQQVETALREGAERERAIAKAIERMRRTLDMDAIFRATTEELRQTLNCDRVAIYRFNSDWSGDFVAESVAQGWISLVQAQQDDPHLTDSDNTVENERCVVKSMDVADNSVLDTYLQDTQGGAYSRGVSYLCVEDIYHAGFDSCYIELLERFQAKAYITVPIFCGDKLWGLLANYQNSAARQWKEAEINVVVQIGTQLGVALQQAELLAQTRRQSLELMKAKDAADAANRAKSRFLAKMSHELRTPLNAILGFSQMMTRSPSLSSEQHEYLEIINRSGEYLLELINDILSMAKIEAGQISLTENCFDLHGLLASLEEMFQLKANAKDLLLKVERTLDVPQYVQTDENKLRQVLINLLSNGIKFTSQGSVTLRAMGNDDASVERETQNTRDAETSSTTLSASSTSTPKYRLVFQVEDTGCGIAPNELPTIFDPFVQTKTGRQSMQGTGLGLAISQQFVRLMGGDISVSSQLGHGTTFTFDIQVCLVASVQEKTISTTQRVLGLQPNQPNYRILVVEDVRVNRRLLVKLLGAVGFEVQEAENGQQGIDAWERWQPHLIFMDMQMPVMDGYEATKEIKKAQARKLLAKRGETQDEKSLDSGFKLQNREHQTDDPLHPLSLTNPTSTVIIALTASAFEEQRLAILEAGCDDFLRKPFREEQLFEKIAHYVGVRYIYESQ